MLLVSCILAILVFYFSWTVLRFLHVYLQVVQETIDPNAKIEFRPNTEDDPHKRKPDISRAKELLGWQPKVSLRKGLPLMVSDFRQRIFGDHKEGSNTNNASTS